MFILTDWLVYLEHHGNSPHKYAIRAIDLGQLGLIARHQECKWGHITGVKANRQ